jgi:hypothetical protein
MKFISLVLSDTEAEHLTKFIQTTQDNLSYQQTKDATLERILDKLNGNHSAFEWADPND